MTPIGLRKKDILTVAYKRILCFLMAVLFSISNFTLPVSYNNYIPIVAKAHADGGNNVPVFDPIGDITVAEGGAPVSGGGYCDGGGFHLKVNATDADGDLLTYSAENLPPESSFTPATQIFTWYPMYDQIGDHVIVFKVSDGNGGEAAMMVKITVVPTLINGLPQTWQYAFWGNYNHSASEDSDGDGMTDGEEYLARNDSTKNIAYGKPCVFSPDPTADYTYDADGSDVLQLTDGFFVKYAQIWGQQRAVGWPAYKTSKAIIKIDLETEQPINEVKYFTASGWHNTPWPAHVYLLTSPDDVNYYFVSDLVSDSPPPTLTEQDANAVRHTFFSKNLNTRGRFVKLIVLPIGSSNLCVDEIQVFKGGTNQPYVGNPYPTDETNLVTALQFTNRIYTDIAALIAKAKVAGLDIASDINNVKGLLNSLDFSTEMTGFKSIIPFDENPQIAAIQRGLIKLNAVILRAEGNSGLVFWSADRWDYLDMYTSPPQGGSPMPAISLNMMNKERRGCTFNLTNAEDTDKTVTIALSGLEENGNPDFFKLYTVGYVDTTGSVLVGDLLQEVPKGAGGYTVNIPAGMTQQLWMEFAPKAFSQGIHAGAIFVTDGATANPINVNISISPYAFSDKLRLSLGAWEYTAGMSKGSGTAWDVNQLNYAAVMKLFNDYQYDSYWTSYEYETSYITAQDFDQNNTFIPPANYMGRSGLSYFDMFDYLALQEHPGKGIYYININGNSSTSFADAEMGTELFNTRVAAWIDAWENHLRSIGISPDRVAMSITDEPYTIDRQKLVIYWGRAIQGRPMRPEPRIKVWEDMTINKPEDILITIDDDDMFTCSDILSPGYWNLERPYYQDQRINHGKMLTFYGVDSPHDVDPYTYGLLNEWGAFKQGATGLNYWLTISGGCNDMNEYIVTKDWNSIVTALYFDDGNPDSAQRVHSGKHWEAMFEGREDYEYLHILSIFIDYMKEKDPTNSAIVESETLRQNTIDVVIQGAFGDNYDNGYQPIKWSDPQDRSIADTQRNLVWNKINQLSGALNVSSLHKIKVTAGQGGVISPPGSDYYAPDRFFIIAQGESQPFTITSDSGYRIQDVLVDGISVGAVSSYTFTAVQDHSIIANFVASPNQPPILDPIEDKTADEGTTLQFTVNATGNGSLTYSAQGLPPGAAFDPATHTFTWTPTYQQAGSYNMTFTVTDGALSDSETILINSDFIDTNLNGMPDTWEMEHFGNLNQDPNADYDNDGLTNIEEYALKTDPKVADVVDTSTQRSAYNFIRQSDETQKIAPDTFMRTVIPARYHFVKPFEIVFFNAHNVDTNYDDPTILQLDMDMVRHILTNAAGSNYDPDYPIIAAGTYIGIDLEAMSTSGGVNKWLDYNVQTLEPNLEVINARAAIISAAKAIRPDCYFGYYAVPQASPEMNLAQLDVLYDAEKPVMDAADFIAPSLYWAKSTYTAAFMASWAKVIVEIIKKHYPYKKIIPFVWWAHWLDFIPDMWHLGHNWGVDYPWTPELVSQYTASGPDWRQFLNALSDAGVNDIVAYTDGTWMPWDPQAPWWLETVDWLSNTCTVSVSAGANGSISPNGPNGKVSLNYYSSQAFTITSDTNYHVTDVLVDGVSVGAVTTYTFSNVKTAHTISANFVINNRPPILDPIGNKSATEGQALSFTVNATDPDGDNLIYMVDHLPQGASFDPITRTFTWTPTYQQAGTYNMTFTATDGALSDSKTITLTSDFLDTNLNGMPDTWEMQYFGNLNQDPNADYDGDGVTNIEEYKAGTDPTVAPREFFVSSDGNDNNIGTIDKPFATLTGARDAIRVINKSPADFIGAVVNIRGGNYTLTDSFALGPEDSGTEQSPIVYQAYQGEKVTISGGKIVANFVPVPDTNSVASRLDPSARSHIMQTDLSQAGITDFGVLAHGNYAIPNAVAALALFFNDQPMTLARWPNTGWEKISTGGTTSFKYTQDRPGRWRDLSDIWIHGYFTADWADDHEKVASLDINTRTVTSDMASFGYAAWQDNPRTQGGRFYYENVLEELDSPGEWYLDRTSGILYFWPTGPITGNNVAVSTLKSPLITLSNASYVTFNGLDLDICRNTGVVINGGGHNNISNCLIHNMGNDGINIISSVSNKVSDCEISYTGDAGVMVGGGDYATLTPGNNLIENNSIHDYAQWVRANNPGVMVIDVGNTVKNNIIYNAPHAGIMIEGNDHMIEYNEIYNVATETCDVGAIYINTSHDWQQREVTHCSYGYSYRGTVIQYNYIHDIASDPTVLPLPADPYELTGIYVDDIASGTTIFGNIINNVPLGILGSNGGRDNRVENNIILNRNSYGILMAQCAFTSFHIMDGLYYELTTVNYQKPPYDKYPNLATMWEEKEQPQHAKYCTILSNIVCTSGSTPIELTWMMNGDPDENFWAQAALDVDTYITRPARGYIQQYFIKYYGSDTYCDPNPVDNLLYTVVHVENNFKIGTSDLAKVKFAAPSPTKLSDFELAADSPMWKLEFQRIPIENIGCSLINTYALTINSQNGTVIKYPDSTSYAAGSKIKLTANPNAGYEFIGWTGDITDTANPITVIMDADKTITPVFELSPVVPQPPVLDPIDNKTATEGTTLQFRVNATGSGSLTYSAQALPPGAIFDVNTHTFTWTPTYKQAGSYNVTFTVTNGTSSDSKTITITSSFIDTDADGMPDTWEIEKFGNLDQTASSDYDNDGLTNIEEYELRTDPKVADVVDTSTQRSVYDWISQGDETGTMGRWLFVREFPKRYPFVKPFEIVYLNDHTVDTHYDDPTYLQLDMDRVRQILNDPDITPGTYIALDLEPQTTTSGVYKWMDYNYTALPNYRFSVTPNIDEINAKAAIITACKAIRPDCYFGYYYFPQTINIWLISDSVNDPEEQAELDAIEQASAPVINASDFIAPDMYWYGSPYSPYNDSYWTVDNVKYYVQQAIARTKKYYPNKKIIPFASWVHWSYITSDMTGANSYSYHWTPEILAQLTVPGPDWRQFLDALSAAGVNDIILWTGGTQMPWDPQAPWWLETLDWRANTCTVSVSASVNGSISPNEPDGKVPLNYYSSQTFAITPDSGCHITDVLVDGTSVGAVASYTFTNIKTAHTISANFVINNRPPVLDTIGNQSATEGQALSFTVNATDPDGDSLIYMIDQLPGGASFDPITHTFTWTPTDQQAGSYNVTFTVTDGTLFDSKTITITSNFLDTNLNGMPDTWEMTYFGNLNQDPNADYDNDGLTNIQEYRNGSDPTVTDQDIALGKTYHLDPLPNGDYDGSKYGGNDMTNLTDGLFTNPGLYMWGQAGCVSWATNAVTITIDLDSDQPVSAVKYSTVALAEQNILWPKAVYVLASQNGQDYYFITDMMQDDPNIPPVVANYGLSQHYKITATGLDTHARYIRIIVVPDNLNVNTDEIQVFGGGKNMPYQGVPISNDPNVSVTTLKLRARIYSDVNMLRDRATQEGVNIDAGLGNIKSRIQNFDDYYNELSPFKTLIPLPFPEGYDGSHEAIGAIQRDLIKLNSSILTQEGYSGLVVWKANRWDPLDVYSSPKDGNILNSIQLNIMNKEDRGEIINLTNADIADKTVTLNISGFGGVDNPGWIKVYKVQCTDIAQNMLVSDMLREVPLTGSGYTIDIPSGMTQQLWIKFMPTSFAEGSYTGNIRIQDGGAVSNNISVNMSIPHYVFPDKLSLSFGMWDYFYTLYRGATNPECDLCVNNADALKQICRDYKYDAYWEEWDADYTTIKESYFDASDKLTLPSDYFTHFDKWVNDFPDMPVYYVNFGANTTKGGTFAGVNVTDNPEKFNARIRAWAEAWEDHLVNDLGMAPYRVEFSLIDEPNAPVNQIALINYGKAFRDRPIRYGSKIELWTDMSLGDPGYYPIQNLNGEDVFSVSDILCPGPSQLLNIGLYNDQRLNHGKKLSFYNGSQRNFDPYGLGVLREWIAFQYGVTAEQGWCIIDSCGSTDLNEYTAQHAPYTPLYFDSTDPTGYKVYISKQFEALFEGREDYEYLLTLRMLVDYLKDRYPENSMIDEGETTIQNAISAVLGPLSGTGSACFNNFIAWNTDKDRAVADTQRDIIFNKINKISKAINVTSLHKVEVRQGSGGVITPSGTESSYYAPSKYRIVADNESQPFTIIPSQGQRIKEVFVDGLSVGAVSNYVFNSVNKDHTIQAVFEVVPSVMLDPIGDQTADEGTTLQFTVSATGSGSLTYLASGLPPGATFDPATHTFTWTPTYTQAGTYSITFTARDGALSDSKTITITSHFLDTNVNGMPDTWEMEHFGDLNQDPNADYDNDGLTNIEEYRAGTDPTVNSNIALGKTYTMDPAPNYSLCTGASDTTDLTDGNFKPAAYWSTWVWPGCVGWVGYDNVSITFDLGSDQPIDTIKYYTSAQKRNVDWPRNIFVLVSDDDVNFHFLTDMVRDSPPPDLLSATSDVIRYVFTSADLNTHGRYVRLVTTKGLSGCIFCEEVQIFNGGTNQAYQGDPLPTSKDPMICALKLISSMQKDLDMVKTGAVAAGLDLSAGINALQSRITDFSDFSGIENIKTVYPQPSTSVAGQIQLDTLKLNSTLLRYNGFSDIVAWGNNKWDPVDPYTAPPGDLSTESDIYMMNGEARGETVNIANASDTAKTVNISIEGFGGTDNPDWIRVYMVQPTITMYNDTISDMVIELTKAANGYSLDIPAGMTQQIWIRFAPIGLANGHNPGTLTIAGDQVAVTDIPIDLNISSYRFPQKFSLSLGMWDYFDSRLFSHAACYGLTDENYPAIKNMTDEYDLSSHWNLSYEVNGINGITAGNFDAQNHFIPSVNYFTIFDRWIQEFPDEPIYSIVLSPDTNGIFAGTSLFNDLTNPDSINPAFTARVAGWASAWEDHLYALGVDPSRVAFLIIDESSTPEQDRTIIAWAQAIRDREPKYGSRIQVWEDHWPHPTAMITLNNDTANTASDILCPHFGTLAKNNVTDNGFQLYDNLRQKNGKKLQLYNTELIRETDPYAYETLMEWTAFKYGASTVNYWCVIDTGGCNDMNEYLATGYTPLYIDGPTVHSSKHFESIFEGREDYEYLMILTMFDDYLKERYPGDSANINALETIRQNALANVLNPVFGENFGPQYITAINWQTPKDRSIVDTQRDIIWNEINQISSAYGVSCLYRIEVNTIGNGSIAPGGTENYYYAPSKYEIVKNGEDKTFTITPNAGNKISYLIIDGKFQNVASSYIFTNINASHSIKAVFEAIPSITLDPIGNETANEGDLLQFTIHAISTGAGSLTYSAQGLPPGAVFDTAAHTFTWTPTYQQAGTYSVTFTATDGTLSDSKTSIITSNFLDTNLNGMPDTWEMQYFGDLAQDPNADYDGDGLSNIEEYKAGTDPTVNSNIALGKTYTMDPAPNYSLCTGLSDVTDLTDDKFASGNAIWGYQECVGWDGYDYVNITFDLGSSQPINAIKYYTASQRNNGNWPSDIFVLVSDDNIDYYYLTDMVLDSPPPVLPLSVNGSDNHIRYTFTSTNLNTHARYVRFVPARGYSSGLFCDEIEIFRGGTGQACQGSPLPIAKDSMICALKLISSMQKDLNIINARAATAELDLTTGINVLQGRINAFGDFNGIANMKTVFPQPSGSVAGQIQLDTLALNSKLIQNSGFSGIAVWCNNRWDPVGPYTPPPGYLSTKSDIYMMNGEIRGETVNIANASDAAKTVNISIKGFGGPDNPEWIRVYKVQPTITIYNETISDMLVELTKTGAGYSLDIPAGMTQQVWVKYAPVSLTQGTNSGIISMDDGTTLSVDLHISNYAMPQKLSLHLGMWEYVDVVLKGWAVNGVMNSTNVEAVERLMRDYKDDIPWYWGSDLIPNSTAFDSNNNFTPPPGYFDIFDNWASIFPDASFYAVAPSLSLDGGFAGVNIFTDTAKCNAMIASWMVVLEDHFHSIGIEPGKVLFLIVDEPADEQRQKTVIAWGKAMRNRPKKYSSHIQVFEDTSGGVGLSGMMDPQAAITVDGDTVYSVSDILCPYDRAFISYGDPTGGFDFFEDQRVNHGKVLGFYVNVDRSADPYALHLLHEWIAYRYGAEIVQSWSLTDTGGVKNLNEYVTSNTANHDLTLWSPLYFDGANVYSSKRWEAILEGRQDYEYLNTLRMFIDYLKEKDPVNQASVITAAETAISTAVEAVLAESLVDLRVSQPISSEAISYIEWNTDKDRSIADTQRNLIWDKINQLSAILNVSSLHKIKVTAGEGGVISPPGSDYYAPDRFFIVADNENQAFTITPSQGQRIKDVFVDGISVGVVSSYPFSNITNDHAIQAVFEIDPTPQPPVLDPIYDKTADEGTTLQFTVNATGSGSLTYLAQGLPPGAAFDPATHTFTWMPTYQQAGTYSVTFTATDGTLSDSKTITITSNFLDTNVNGMPDTWEMTYFGNLNQDPNADYDGDGITNIEEFIGGTDPTTQNLENLVKNGSFADGMDQWDPYGSGIKNIVSGVDGRDDVLYIENNDGTTIGVYQCIDFAEPTTNSFDISYEVKAVALGANALASLDIGVQYVGDSNVQFIAGPFMTTQGDLGKWVKKEWILSLDKAVEKIHVYLLNYYDTSAAYYDNVIIQKLPVTQPIEINNGTSTLSISGRGYIQSLRYQGEETLKSVARLISTVYLKDGSSREVKQFIALGNDTYRMRYLNSDIETTMMIIPHDGYFTFTITDVKDLNSQLKTLEIFNVNAAHYAENDAAWATAAGDNEIFMKALSVNVDAACYAGDGYSCRTGEGLQIVGASGALIVAPKSAYFSTIKQFIIDNKLPYVTEDGQWFRESGQPRESYLLTYLSHDNHEQILNYAKAGGFKQVVLVDIFEKGHYQPTTFASISEFYSDMQEFLDAGISLGIHTFMNRVERGDSLFTVENLYKEQVGTLTADLGPTINIDNDLMQNKEFLFYSAQIPMPRDLAIDGEIIEVTDENIKNGSLTNCKRGLFGTTEQSHSAGAAIYILPNAWVGFYIDPKKTDAVKESAAALAAMIDRLHIKMLYCDGDSFIPKYGMDWQVACNYREKYAILPYVNEMMSRNINVPVFQSGGYTSSFAYYYKDKSASWDAVFNENKEFTRLHKVPLMLGQSAYSDILYEMGWWTINSAEFASGKFDYDATTFDDLDYAMVKTLVLGRSMGFEEFFFDNGNMEGLLKRFNDYFKLAQQDIESGVIPADLKARLADPEAEAELVGGTRLVLKQVDRKYADMSGSGSFDYPTPMNNPFVDQRLKVEIRPRFDYYGFDDLRNLLINDFSDSSALGVTTSDPKIMCTMTNGGNITITNNSAQKGFVKIALPVPEELYNLTNKRGIGLSIVGDGKNESVTVQLNGGGAVRNYQCLVDFSRSRQIIIGNTTRGPVGPDQWLFVTYSQMNFSSINAVSLYIGDLDPGQTYSLKLNSVKALAEKGYSELVHPTVTMNGQTITFPVTLYVNDTDPNILEYDGATGKYKLYASNYGLISENTIAKDNILVKNGMNTVSVGTDTTNSDYSTRADVRITVRDSVSQDTYALAITAANGQVDKVPDKATYNHGETIQLTATPSAGYHFVNWAGDAAGATNPVTITMDANKSVTANFAINTYIITASAGENGMIAPQDATSANYGDNKTMTITPNAGYYILDVSVDGVSQGVISSYAFTKISANHTISATFSNANRPPILDAIKVQSVIEGSVLKFVVNATDPDKNDILTYSASGLPQGAIFDNDTKTFMWVPETGQAGEYSVTFEVTDSGKLQASKIVAISVTKPATTDTGSTGSGGTYVNGGTPLMPYYALPIVTMSAPTTAASSETTTSPQSAAPENSRALSSGSIEPVSATPSSIEYPPYTAAAPISDNTQSLALPKLTADPGLHVERYAIPDADTAAVSTLAPWRKAQISSAEGGSAVLKKEGLSKATYRSQLDKKENKIQTWREKLLRFWKILCERVTQFVQSHIQSPNSQ